MASLTAGPARGCVDELLRFGELGGVAGVALSALTVATSAAAAGHVVLNKRDPRAAIAWTVFVLLVPLAGPLAYLLLGVNRIRRRATALRAPVPSGAARFDPDARAPEGSLAELAAATDRVSRRPLLGGNRVTPLSDGDEAYPEMLAAIDGARGSVALCTYIFDGGEIGRSFVAALTRAVARGVEVRVLVDAVGLRYSFPSTDRALRRAGLPVGVFMPTWSPLRAPFGNLRCHRKLCVVDGVTAFTGGLNIRDGHVLARRRPDATADLHFRVEGPVVRQLMEVFADDWAFVTREALDGARWFPPALPTRGGVVARALPDGPENARDPLRWTRYAALALARRRVLIATPYFIPDQGLITALNTAALRGVAVDVVLPARGNIRVAEWAQTAQLWQTLEHGCRVHLQPAPFDHTKLMIVDDAWALVGSANWDARSLRLNFELDLECHDAELVSELARRMQVKLARSREVTLADVDGRSLPVRLRDGLARLWAPYL